MNDYKQIADHWMEENRQLTDDNIKLKARVMYLEEQVYAIREIMDKLINPSVGGFKSQGMFALNNNKPNHDWETDNRTIWGDFK